VPKALRKLACGGTTGLGLINDLHSERVLPAETEFATALSAREFFIHAFLWCNHRLITDVPSAQNNTAFLNQLTNQSMNPAIHRGAIGFHPLCADLLFVAAADFSQSSL